MVGKCFWFCGYVVVYCIGKEDWGVMCVEVIDVVVLKVGFGNV